MRSKHAVDPSDPRAGGRPSATGFGGPTTTAASQSSPQVPDGGSAPSGPSRVLRTVYLPSERADALLMTVQSLQQQLDETKRLMEERVQVRCGLPTLVVEQVCRQFVAVLRCYFLFCLNHLTQRVACGGARRGDVIARNAKRLGGTELRLIPSRSLPWKRSSPLRMTRFTLPPEVQLHHVVVLGVAVLRVKVYCISWLHAACWGGGGGTLQSTSECAIRTKFRPASCVNARQSWRPSTTT